MRFFARLSLALALLVTGLLPVEAQSLSRPLNTDRSRSGSEFLSSGQLILDRLNMQAGAAWGSRKLRAAYAGPAMRIRRSSDNAEMDIGFSTTADANGDYWVSTADIIAFCPSGIGYLTTWYDQSGNGRHATQSSAVLQPAVISGGVIYNINGQPALSINNNQLTFTEFAVGTVIAVTTVDPSAPFLSTLISRVGQDKTIRRTQTTGNGWRSVSGNPTGADLARQPGSYVNGVAASGTSDGGPIIPQVFTTPTITVFNTYFAPTAYAMLSSLFWHTTQAARYFTGKSSEIILMQYTGELSASDRATLTANQATAYGITVAP